MAYISGETPCWSCFLENISIVCCTATISLLVMARKRLLSSCCFGIVVRTIFVLIVGEAASETTEVPTIGLIVVLITLTRRSMGLGMCARAVAAEEGR